MRRAIHLFVALATVGLVSPACGYGFGDVGAGDCFQTGTTTAFAWDTEVSCNRLHTVEVFAVRDVSATLGNYPRSALNEDGNPARQQYLALITSFCEPAWSDYTGFSELGSSVAPDAVVLPAIYGEMALEAAPAAEWDSGNRIVVCYQVLGRPETKGEQPIVADHPVLATLREPDADVPVAVRDCALSPADGNAEQRVSCAVPHDREYLGHLNLAQFVGHLPGLDQAFLDRFDSVTASAEDRAVLDTLCGQVFAPLLGAQRPDVTLRAQVYTRDATWGWANDGYYHAACFALIERPITGSIVGIGNRPLG